MNFDEATVRLTSQFDVSQAQATAFLNERLARRIAESEWALVKKSLGTTTANVSNYQIPADLVDLQAVRVDNGTDTALYYATSLDDLWRADVGARDATGFALDYQADGDVEIRLSPAPDTAGLTITGLYAALPSTLTYGSSAAVPIPVDVHTHWLAGGQADCYDLEGRQDLSAKYEARCETGIEKLRRRRNSRGDGAAPTRLRLKGWDY